MIAKPLGLVLVVLFCGIRRNIFGAGEGLSGGMFELRAHSKWHLDDSDCFCGTDVEDSWVLAMCHGADEERDTKFLRGEMILSHLKREARRRRASGILLVRYRGWCCIYAVG